MLVRGQVDGYGGHSVRRARAGQVDRDRQRDPGKLVPSGHKAAIFLPGPVGAYTPIQAVLDGPGRPEKAQAC